ncbi:hypothetical protein JCM10207_002198 [Rhodosporidiobolus poonsookiae]
MQPTASEFEFSQSQFTQTQPATQQQSQPLSQQHPRFPPNLWGLLLPVGTGSTASLTDAAYDAQGGSTAGGSGGPGPARIELCKGKDTYVVGRHPTRCDIVLNGPKISSFHAKIVRSAEDGLVRLLDTSTNGTFVRGNKVGKNNMTVLDPGDEVIFGPFSSNFDSDFRYVFKAPSSLSSASDPYNLGELSQGGNGIHSEYEVREQLGKGSFAVVRKGIRRSDGKMVAIKIINKSRFASNPATLKMFSREIEIVKTLEHPFCVRCYAHFEDDQRIWLVLEYVDGGDLLDYVMKRRGLKETEVRELALMICQAVAYLHSRGITHRDLKPENLLLTKGSRPQCKVTDFGLAKMVDDQTRLMTMCGTPTYLAPEVILSNGTEGGYKSIVDAYSIGVILYSCLTNQTPFDESEATPLPERMRQRYVDYGYVSELVSPEGLDFLQRLLENNPLRRMTCAQALEHPWLKTKDAKSSGDSLPFALGAFLPYNSGSAGNTPGEMLPPARHGAANVVPSSNLSEPGDVTLLSTASLTSPAVSSRIREGEDSMVDSQGFGNLRINHSEASLTTPDISEPAPPFSRPPLAPLPESVERLPDAAAFSSPQVAGQKRKEMMSRFSDSSLSELPSQPSQDVDARKVVEADFAPGDEGARDEARAMSVDEAAAAAGRDAEDSAAAMSGIEEEKEGADDETDDREPSTVEEVDTPETPASSKRAESSSPRTTRRTSRAAPPKKAAGTPARRGGRTRASSATTSTTNGDEGSAASASLEREISGIAAGVKSRRRKAARYT